MIIKPEERLAKYFICIFEIVLSFLKTTVKNFLNYESVKKILIIHTLRLLNNLLI